jgi:hypothetical protein
MDAPVNQEPPNGTAQENLLSPGPEARTPTQADHRTYTPVISTFSTTTRDLEPYPRELLGTPTNPEAAGTSETREALRENATNKDVEKDQHKMHTGAMQGIEKSPEPINA